MTVKTTLKTISTPDKDIVVFAKDFNRLIYELGTKAFRPIQSPLLDELQFYPPPLPNQRYVRTYRLRQGWKAGIRRLNGNTYAMVISNDVEYTQQVVGSLAQVESVAARFQDAIHRGRWPLATTTVKFWQEAFLELLEEKVASDLSHYGTVRNSRRAFTSRSR